jgi:DNA polymerase I-like protein with 3'-5' exonuclease and polymerase domains
MIINPSLHTIESISGHVGLDVETTGLKPWVDAVHSIAIATDKDKLYVIDVSAYDHDELAKSLQYMVNNSKLIMHNAKFDVGFLYGFFGVLARDVWCTQLAAQILYNGKLGIRFNLISVLKIFLDIDVMEDNHKKLMRELYMNHKPGEVLSKTMLEYVADDTRHLLPLMREQERLIEQDNMPKVIQLENLLVTALAKMEVDGCLIDREGWIKAIKEWEEREEVIISELDAELVKLSEDFPVLKQAFYTGTRKQATQFDIFGEKFDNTIDFPHLQYSSQAQVIGMLEDMGVEVPLKKVKDVEYQKASDSMKERMVKRKKYWYKKSVGEEPLQEYINENPDTILKPFYHKLLEYRQNGKLLSTYGEAFLENLDSNGRVHTQYTQCRTATGRLSSLAPNLQNIPSVVREFFIPSGDNTFITSDMNSAEVSIAGDYSKEKLLIDAVLHDEDLHSKMASGTFSILFGEEVVIDKSSDILSVGGHDFVKYDLRDIHKRVLFSKFYKGGAARIYTILAYYINLFHKGDARMKIARKISTAVDKALPRLTSYLSELIEIANETGQLRGTTLLNRVRYFGKDVYGEAANFPIQNTNAEAMKIALVNLFEYLDETGDGRLVLNVHDEVVVETTKEKAEKVGTEVAKIMGDSLGMFLEDIKGGASINIGHHWKK